MLRVVPALTVLLLIGPILCGVAATVLPAFGWFPVLGGHHLSLDPWHALLAEPGLWRSVGVSFFTGLVATAVSLGVVALFIAGWSGTRGFRAMTALVSPLLSVPHAAAAFALAFLIAPSGWLARVFSPWATGWDRPPDLLIVHDAWGVTMTLALVAKEVPFLMLVALAAMPQTGWRERGALSAGLGYGRVRGFFLGVWPALYPQIRLAVFAVLAYSTSVVDVAAILGPVQPAPLAVRLVDWMGDADLSRRFMACAGAMLQGALTLAAILVWLLGERLAGWWRERIIGRGVRAEQDGLVRAGGAVAVTVGALVVLGGLTVLAMWSVATFWGFPNVLPDGWTGRTWMRAWPGVGDAVWTTLTVGLAATAIAVVLTVGCLEREWRTGNDGGSRALGIVYLPLIVPQAAFVFGLQLFALWAGWDATWGALMLVHLVFVLPYVFLSLSDPWRAWDRRLGAVAHGLGRGDGSVLWRVRLPMLARALGAAAAVGFAVSVGQYLPTVLIGAGRLVTVTTEAVALGSGGDRRVIGVWAVVQMGLPFAAFMLAALVPAIAFRNRRAMRAA